MTFATRPWVPVLALLLAACGGYDGAPEEPVLGPIDPDLTPPAESCDELFTQRVQPRLAFCRTCHIPGGVGDVPNGDKFQLASDAARLARGLACNFGRP